MWFSKFDIKAFLLRRLRIDERANALATTIISRENYFPINETQKEDIFIAAYPKSGVTWMQNLIVPLLLGADPEKITPRIVSELIPDVHAKKYYKRFFSRMVFKTHFTPRPEYRKVIHLVRDGRDSLVSYHHYLKLNGKRGFTLDEMIDKVDCLWPCRWTEHTELWRKNPYNAEIVEVRYEDLIYNPLVEMKRIAEFCGEDIAEDKLREIVEMNKINNMRRKVVLEGWDYDNTFGTDSAQFFRKGIIGDYKNYMSENQIERFNSYSKENLLRFKYDL